jgi:hypothetical protein
MAQQINEGEPPPSLSAQCRGGIRTACLRFDCVLRGGRLFSSLGEPMRSKEDSKAGRPTRPIGESGAGRGVVRSSRLIVLREDP